MKGIKALWEQFKVWRRSRATVRSMRLFQSLLKDKTSGMQEIVQRNSLRMAGSMVMNWLDKRGTAHCRFCPGTDQLRRHLDFMVCPDHWAAITAKPSANGVEEKEKAVSK